MSKVLARVMLDEPLVDRRILEIGCGLALPSIVAKHLGGNITASDYHPLAGRFLKRNTELNCLQNIPYYLGDWNYPEQGLEKFDLIVGSDLLYEVHHVKLLANFIDSHLTENGKIILVDPGRGSHRHFAKEMYRYGFECLWTDLSAFPADEKSAGYIFRFHRSKALSKRRWNLS